MGFPGRELDLSHKHLDILPPIHPVSLRCLRSPYTPGTTRSGALRPGRRDALGATQEQIVPAPPTGMIASGEYRAAGFRSICTV